MKNKDEKVSKFTPGPWHVIERAGGQAFSVACQVQTKGNFLTTHYIANITDGATPQCEANAVLIAAAPDMYDALRKCKDFATKTGSEPDILIIILKQIEKISQAALRAADGGNR